jgi:hypothetical protein
LQKTLEVDYEKDGFPFTACITVYFCAFVLQYKNFGNKGEANPEYSCGSNIG